jgi:transposase
MGAAYADDLRRKLLEAYQREEGSLAVLAGRFSVSLGWAEKIWRAYRASGQMERPVGSKRGRASKLTPEMQQQLQVWIQRQPDLTLKELQGRLADEHKVEVVVSRLWKVLKDLQLRLKKSPSTLPNRTRSKANSGALRGGKRSGRSRQRS